MPRGGPHDGDPQCDVDHVAVPLELKGYHTLIVIHSYNCIEPSGKDRPIDGIGRKRALHTYAFFPRGLDGGPDYLLLFPALFFRSFPLFQPLLRFHEYYDETV